ncbi:MAG: hypothetical protein HQL29_03410 [Candidatus Omnitrophica bacterium]|nr:hypothetical protein [Candidatus Omnitrophota bacterium]
MGSENNKYRQSKRVTDISLEKFKNRVREADLNKYFVAGSVVLVICIGIYALFSPVQKNARLSNPACGKIVVAADGSNLRSNVSPTLEGAKYFLIINPLSQKLLESALNPYFAKPGTQSEIAYFVAGKGEEAVIAGSINPTSYKILGQFGVRGFGGYSGKVKTAVDLYRQARISQGMSGVNGNVGTQVAFGFGKKWYICPACNWQMEVAPGNNFPVCPNCKMSMATDVNKRWWNNVNPFDWVANTVPVQGQSQVQTQGQVPMGQQKVTFWQGPETTGFFICPQCNWQMSAQRDLGQYPTCPNCSAKMARSGIINQDTTMSPFICPTCNWQTLAKNNTGVFPVCPNCKSTMAVIDATPKNAVSSFASPGVQGKNLQTVALGQLASAPTFWQGPDSTGFFICPKCNWQMKSQNDLGQYPTCPNCKAIMARTGMVTQDLSLRAYVCPICNWNTTAKSIQGQFPVCSNCGSQMALAGQNAVIASAAPTYMICPSCNWQVNAQSLTGRFARCPNCQAIMTGPAVEQGVGTMGPAGRNGQTSNPGDRTPANNDAGNQQVAFVGNGTCVVR